MQPSDQMDPRTAAAVQKAMEKVDLGWREKFAQAQNDSILRRQLVEKILSMPRTDALKLAREMYSFIVEPFAAPES